MLIIQSCKNIIYQKNLSTPLYLSEYNYLIEKTNYICALNNQCIFKCKDILTIFLYQSFQILNCIDHIKVDSKKKLSNLI